MLKIAIYYWFNPYRGYEWPLYLKSVLCVCLIVLGNFSNYSPHPSPFLSFIVLSYIKESNEAIKRIIRRVKSDIGTFRILELKI